MATLQNICLSLKNKSAVILSVAKDLSVALPVFRMRMGCVAEGCV